MLLNVAAFLPPFIKEKFSEPGNELDETDGAMILAVFFIAQIVFAPFNSYIKNFFGSKNTILIGFFMMTVTTYGLGFIAYIDDAQLFKWVAVIIRFFQGQGDIMLQITCYTVITTVFSDNVMKYISYIEIVVGMGLAMGPAIGAVFDKFTNYEYTMYIFGVLNTVAMVCCYWFLPKELNKTENEAAVAELEAEVANLLEIDE